jgi:hypothetical protein
MVDYFCCCFDNDCIFVTILNNFGGMVTKQSKNFIIANIVLLLSWALLSLTTIDDLPEAVLLAIYTLYVLAPFWCLCYSRADLADIHLHIFVMIGMFALTIIVCFLIFYIFLDGFIGLCIIPIFYIILIIIISTMRKRKYFNALWFSMHSISAVVATVVWMLNGLASIG